MTAGGASIQEQHALDLERLRGAALAMDRTSISFAVSTCRKVEFDRFTKERPEGGLVDLFALVDVDRAARFPETRVEEAAGSFSDAPLANVSLTTFL